MPTLLETNHEHMLVREEEVGLRIRNSLMALTAAPQHELPSISKTASHHLCGVPTDDSHNNLQNTKFANLQIDRQDTRQPPQCSPFSSSPDALSITTQGKADHNKYRSDGMSTDPVPQQSGSHDKKRRLFPSPYAVTMIQSWEAANDHFPPTSDEMEILVNKTGWTSGETSYFP